LKIFRILDSGVKELVNKSVVVFFIKIFGSLLAFIFTLLLTNSLGATEAGYYFLAFSIMSFLVPFASLGMNNVVLKLVSLHHDSGNDSEARNVVFKSVGLVFFISMFLAISVFLNVDWIAHNVFNKAELSATLGGMIWTLPLIVLYTLISHAVQGFNKVAYSMFITGPSIYIFLLILLYIGEVEHAKGVAEYLVSSAFVTLLLALWFLPIKLNGTTKENEKIKKMLTMGIPMMGIQIVVQVNLHAGQILLGLFGSASEVAYFSVAMKLATLTSVALMAVNRVVSVKFSVLHHAGKHQELKNIVKWSTRIMVSVAFPICIFMMVFPDFVLSYFGPEYKQGATILIILSFAQLINSATGSVGYLMQMTGLEKIHMKNVTLAAVLSVVLGWVTIPYIGALGAAIMVACSMVTRNLLSWYFVKKKLNINTLNIF
jgi:O-antigen/teichoic acid export membrane protein